MKRITVMLLVFVLVFSLLACSRSGSSDEGSQATPTLVPASQELVEDTGQGEQDDSSGSALTEDIIGITLPAASISGQKATIMSWWDPAAEQTMTIAGKFNEFYGAELEFMMVGWGDLTTQLISMLGAGIPPDLVMLRGEDYPRYAGAGYLMPLDNLINYDTPLWAGMKPVIENMKYDGRIYNSPAGVGVNYFLWYNRDIFDNAGLEYPEDLYARGEWTWPVLFDYIKAAADPTGATEMYGLAGDANIIMCAMIMSAGSDTARFEDGKYVLNNDDPNFIEVMNIMDDLYNNLDVMSPTDSSAEYFTSGRAAMFFDGMWMDYNEPLLTMHQRGTVSIIMFPQWTAAGPNIQWAMMDGLAIPRGASNPELSAAVINMFRYIQVDPVEEEKGQAELRQRGWTDFEIDMLDEAGSFAVPMVGFSLGSLSSEIWMLSRRFTWGQSFSSAWSEQEPLCQQALDEFNELMSGS